MSLLVLTLALSPQGADDPAALHPAGSVAYLDVPDVPGAIEAYQRTALFQTLRDPEIQALAGSVVGVDSLDPFALLEAEYRAAVERGEIPPLWELVIEPLVDGWRAARPRVGTAVTIRLTEVVENPVLEGGEFRPPR